MESQNTDFQLFVLFFRISCVFIFCDVVVYGVHFLVCILAEEGYWLDNSLNKGLCASIFFKTHFATFI